MYSVFSVYDFSLLTKVYVLYLFFFFKQKTAYDMRISDWSSDVCSSDLKAPGMCVCPGKFGIPTPGVTLGMWTPTHTVTSTRNAFCFPELDMQQIGRASCRARVCQYV